MEVAVWIGCVRGWGEYVPNDRCLRGGGATQQTGHQRYQSKTSQHAGVVQDLPQLVNLADPTAIRVRNDCCRRD